MHGDPSSVLHYLGELKSRKMAALVHPSHIPLAADGLKVGPAGAFGVPKGDMQRAITNRQARNASQLFLKSANPEKRLAFFLN